MLSVLVILDAWPSAQTHDLIAAGRLPEIQDWLTSSGSGIFDTISPYLSFSYSSHASLLTAAPPSVHGIPAHLWIDRPKSRVFNIQTAAPRRAAQAIDVNARTVFEHVGGGSAIHGLITRGATRIKRPLSKDPVVLIRHLINGIRANRRGLHVCWLPSVDAAGHRFGPDSSEFLEAICATSRALDALFGELERIDVAKQVLLASDHGMRPSGELIGSAEIRSIVCPGLSSNVWVNPLISRHADLDKVNALTTGGSVLHVYLPRRSKVDMASSVAGRALSSGKVALAVLSDADGQHLLTPSGQHTVSPTLTPPVGLFDAYPDIFQRIAESRVPDREPDVTLVSRDEFYFGKRVRPGYNWGRHRGTHGGPSALESLGVAIGLPVETGREPIPIHRLLRVFGLPRQTHVIDDPSSLFGDG
jgi:hypothetical protein